LNTQTSKPAQEIPLLAAADIASVEMSPRATGNPTGVIEVAMSKSGAGAKSAVIKSSSKENNVGSTEDLYVVEKGDTLGSIAKKKLGKSSKWKDIATANGSSLSDPAVLSPGMTIRLPKTN
jgi:nucleoid-associated protein YgaU